MRKLIQKITKVDFLALLNDLQFVVISILCLQSKGLLALFNDLVGEIVQNIFVFDLLAAFLSKSENQIRQKPGADHSVNSNFLQSE